MPPVAVLEAILRLKDEMSPKLVAAAGHLKNVGDKATRFGSQLKSAAGNLLPLAAAAAAALAVPTTAFADYDDALNSSLAIMGDVSSTMRGEMSDAARQVGVTTQFSATQAAESYFFLASAGLDAAASIEALPRVAAFAQAGQFDMARATDLLTDSQSALGLTIKDDVVANMANMTRVSDVLVKANTLSNASVAQFSEALTNKAGAAMRQLNIDVESGVAVLAAWADQGVKGTEAGEKFNIVTRDLQTAARNNSEAFREYNIDVFDSNGALNSLADIVADVEGALGGMSVQQQGATLSMLGFQDRSVSALRSLLGTSEAIRGYEADLRNAAGITDEIAKKQLNSFKKQLGLTWDRIRNVGISLGAVLVPHMEQARVVVDKAVDAARGAVDWFGRLPKPVQAVAVGVTGLVAVLSPLLFGLGSLVKVAGLAASGLGTLAGSSAFGFVVSAGKVLLGVLSGPAGIAVALGGLLLSIKPVRDLLLDVGSSVLSAVVAGVQRSIDAVRAAADWWRDLWAATEDVRVLAAEIARLLVADVVAAVQRWWQELSVAAGWVRDVVGAGFEWVSNLTVVRVAIDGFRAVLDVLVGAVRKVWEWVGKAKDAILEWLPSTERVIELASKIPGPIGASVRALQDYTARARENVAAQESLASGIETVDGAVKHLAPKLPPVTDGINKLGGGVRHLAPELPKLSAGLGPSGISGASDDAADAIGRLADETERFAGFLPALSTGSQAAAGLWRALGVDLTTAALHQKKLNDAIDRTPDLIIPTIEKVQDLAGATGKDLAGATGDADDAHASLFGTIETGIPLFDDLINKGLAWLDSMVSGVPVLGDLFGSIFGEGGKISSLAQQLFGGGSGSLGGIIGSALGGPLGSIVGNFGAQIGQKILGGLKSIAGDVVSFIGGLFGGPDAAELEAREIVNTFETTVVNGILDAQQQLEAGGEQWRANNIAIRDSYMAIGFSQEEAAAMATRFAEAVRQGPEEAAAVVAELQAVFDQVQEAMDATGLTLTELRNKAINDAARLGITVEEAFQQILESATATAEGAAEQTGNTLQQIRADMVQLRDHQIVSIRQARAAFEAGEMTKREAIAATKASLQDQIPALLAAGPAGQRAGRQILQAMREAGMGGTMQLRKMLQEAGVLEKGTDVALRRVVAESSRMSTGVSDELKRMADAAGASATGIEDQMVRGFEGVVAASRRMASGVAGSFSGIGGEIGFDVRVAGPPRGIPSFQTRPGEMRRVPGPAGRAMPAIVHGGELIGREAPAGRSTSDRPIVVKIELEGRTLAEALVTEIPGALSRSGLR